MKDLPDFVAFKQFPAIPLRDIFSAAGDDLLDLLSKLFRYYPVERCSATEVIIGCYIYHYIRILLACPVTIKIYLLNFG